MLPKVDGLLRKSFKLQPVFICALSRVVKHLVEVLLELRILNLIKDTPDLPVLLASHCFTRVSKLVQVFLVLFNSGVRFLLILLQFLDLISEFIHGFFNLFNKNVLVLFLLIIKLQLSGNCSVQYLRLCF